MTRQNAARSTENVVQLRAVEAPRARPARPHSRRIFGNVSKLPSGRWRARYPDPSYRGPGRAPWINAPTTFLTKGDAAAWVSAREAEIIEHRWRPAPPPSRPAVTFAEYSARWLAGRELKPSTIREYTAMMKHLVVAFGARYVDEIAGADIRAWYATLDRSKPAARAHLYALMHNVLNGAVEDELIDVNRAAFGRPAPRNACARSSRPLWRNSRTSSLSCRTAIASSSSPRPGAHCASENSPNSGVTTSNWLPTTAAAGCTSAAR